MNHLVIFYVEDSVSSRKFYQSLLQVEPSEYTENFAAFPLSESLSLGLWKRTEVKPDVTVSSGGQSEVCLLVADHPSLDAQYEHCTSIGATIIQEPVEMDFGRTFSVCDPDGFRIRYTTPV